ncbi:MAG: class I SAM-dependent methyltransferase, partial [Lachnospiraceae bacterium]|nr:class I SAM-dependent methyltransferase [Lachnospiraceae bacterium]
MKKDANAYEQMYRLIRPAVKGKIVLELATGTGLLAKNIVHEAKMIEATDSSPEMIAQAKRSKCSSKLHFSVQNIFSLPYADESFSVIIAANVLHVIPEPEKALAEIYRVLTSDGLLIAPTFTHGDSKFCARIKVKIMRLLGFPLNHRWSAESYSAFLKANGFRVQKEVFIKASLPLTY